MDIQTTPLAQLKDPSLLKTAALVNGQWVKGSSRFDVNNPATGEIIWRGNAASAEQVREAYRRYRKLQHGLRLNDAAYARVPRETARVWLDELEANVP